MLRAMDSAVAGLRAHQSKLDVIGHNIANVNTYGYKSQNYSFTEAMYQTSSSSTAGSTTAGGVNAAQYGYGSLTGSISMDMTASTPTYVGGFNASISGEGFFITYASPVEVPPAQIKETDMDYTRVGQFKIDSNGYMVDSRGNFVYGYRCNANNNDPADPTDYNQTNLQALKVPDTYGQAVDYNTGESKIVLTDIKINSLGEITGTIKALLDNNGNPILTDPADPTKPHPSIGKVLTLGKLAIVTFQNPEGLTKKGDYYYGASVSDNTGAASVARPGDPATATLMAGYLEASNVDLAKEFSDMITTQRGFQANTKMITVSDEILNELVNMKR